MTEQKRKRKRKRKKRKEIKVFRNIFFGLLKICISFLRRRTRKRMSICDNRFVCLLLAAVHPFTCVTEQKKIKIKIKIRKKEKEKEKKEKK